MSKKKETKTATVTTVKEAVQSIENNVQDQITKEVEAIAEIAKLGQDHAKKLADTRKDKLDMVKALITLIASFEVAGIKLTNVQVAKAYGVHKSWITKAFKVANDKELSKQYLNNVISLLGVNRVIKNDKDALKAEHASMVMDGKKPTALTLSEASGIDIATCKEYLRVYLGKDLQAMSLETCKAIETYLTFRPMKDTNTVTDGKLKLIPVDVKPDERRIMLSGDLFNMITNKEKNAELFVSIMKDVQTKLAESKNKADEIRAKADENKETDIPIVDETENVVTV